MYHHLLSCTCNVFFFLLIYHHLLSCNFFFYWCTIHDDSAVAQKWTDVQLQFSLVLPHQWVSVSTHSLHKAEIQLQCRPAFTHTHTDTHAHTHTNKTKKRKSACVNNVQLAIVSKKSCVSHFGKLIYPITSPGRRSALRSNMIITLLVVIKRRKKYCCIRKR